MSLHRPGGMSSESDYDDEDFEFSTFKKEKKKSYFQNMTNGQCVDNFQNNFSRSNIKGYTGDGIEDLSTAIFQNRLDVVKDIVAEDKSAINTALVGGWTPLMTAAAKPHVEIVDFLLENNANPNAHKDMFTVLMAACSSNCSDESQIVETVFRLLKFGAKPDLIERHRMTSLHFAAKQGRAQVIDELLKAGAQIDLQDNKGWTALCYAASNGHGLAVRKLLEKGADVFKATLHGEIASDIAEAAGFAQMSKIILKSSEAIANDSSALQSLVNQNKDEIKARNSIVSYGEMEMVLSGLDLSELIPLFQSQKINLEIFLRLHETDFEKLGIEAMGTRKKLVDTILQIHKQDWKTTSLTNMSKLPFITVPDSIALVKNVNNHIRYIHASIGYLRDQMKLKPEILELGCEKDTAKTLNDLFSVTLKNSSSLQDEIKIFKCDLKKFCDVAEICDEINAKSRRRRKNILYRAMLPVFALGAVTSLFYSYRFLRQVAS